MYIDEHPDFSYSSKWRYVIGICGLLIVFFSIFTIDLIGDDNSDKKVEDNPNFSANTAWMLSATALVLIMSMPGLALYYGGFSHDSSKVNTMAMVFISYALVTIIWIFYGYTLVYSGDYGGIIGHGSHIFLKGLSPRSVNSNSPTIPEYVFIAYELTFAALTVGLVSGGLIERIKFKAWVLLVILWTTFVYIPIAHWVWAKDGFLNTAGVLDYAGGTVVHLNSGIATLVGTKMLGWRKNPHENPRSITEILIGTSLLWFGFVGFNAGSASAANYRAGLAILNTNISAAVSSIVWISIQAFHTGKPTLSGLCDGAIAGLVAITPGGGYVNPIGAIIIGIFAGIVPYLAIRLKTKYTLYDDTFNTFALHCIGGTVGAILTGVYADSSICRDTDQIDDSINDCKDGFIFGGYRQLGLQFAGVTVCLVYSAVVTALIIICIKYLLKEIRVNEQEESQGMDLTEHGMIHYTEFGRPREMFDIKVVDSLQTSRSFST